MRYAQYHRRGGVAALLCLYVIFIHGLALGNPPEVVESENGEQASKGIAYYAGDDDWYQNIDTLTLLNREAEETKNGLAALELAIPTFREYPSVTEALIQRCHKLMDDIDNLCHDSEEFVEIRSMFDEYRALKNKIEVQDKTQEESDELSNKMKDLEERFASKEKLVIQTTTEKLNQITIKLTNAASFIDQHKNSQRVHMDRQSSESLPSRFISEESWMFPNLHYGTGSSEPDLHRSIGNTSGLSEAGESASNGDIPTPEAMAGAPSSPSDDTSNGWTLVRESSASNGDVTTTEASSSPTDDTSNGGSLGEGSSTSNGDVPTTEAKAGAPSASIIDASIEEFEKRFDAKPEQGSETVTGANLDASNAGESTNPAKVVSEKPETKQTKTSDITSLLIDICDRFPKSFGASKVETKKCLNDPAVSKCLNDIYAMLKLWEKVYDEKIIDLLSMSSPPSMIPIWNVVCDGVKTAQAFLSINMSSINTVRIMHKRYNENEDELKKMDPDSPEAASLRAEQEGIESAFSIYAPIFQPDILRVFERSNRKTMAVFKEFIQIMNPSMMVQTPGDSSDSTTDSSSNETAKYTPTPPQAPALRQSPAPTQEAVNQKAPTAEGIVFMDDSVPDTTPEQLQLLRERGQGKKASIFSVIGMRAIHTIAALYLIATF